MYFPRTQSVFPIGATQSTRCSGPVWWKRLRNPKKYSALIWLDRRRVSGSYERRYIEVNSGKLWPRKCSKMAKNGSVLPYEKLLSRADDFFIYKYNHPAIIKFIVGKNNSTAKLSFYSISYMTSEYATIFLGSTLPLLRHCTRATKTPR